MDYDALIARLDATTCAALKRAIEMGKFPDGRRLSDEQRALCLEAVLAWEVRHLPPEQRTGYIDRAHKTKDDVCDSKGDGATHSHDEQIIHIKSKP